MKKKIVTMVIFATLTAGCSNKAELYNIKIDARLKDEKKILEIVAEQIGYKLSIKQIHEPWIDERVKRDRLMARKLLVSGTPTIYVDGKKDVTREKYKEFMKKK